MCVITKQDLYDVLIFHDKAYNIALGKGDFDAANIFLAAYKSTEELLKALNNHLNKNHMDPKALKIKVVENKNVNLAYPHLKQSIGYPGLIMLFSDKSTATVISIGDNPQFKLGVRYNDLLPDTFRIFRGIIELTQ